MQAKNAVRCPSCGTENPFGRHDCGNCGARLFESGKGSPPIESDLPESVPRPRPVDRSERAFVPVEYEAAEVHGGKKLLEPGDEIKVDRSDMVEKETYQCLICGSTVPALADKCPICGTIFVSEKEAHTFTGIPVARVPRRSELESCGVETLQVPVTEEALNLELPLPRPLSARALKEADILPVLEPVDGKKVVIKKKVVKKTVRKAD